MKPTNKTSTPKYLKTVTDRTAPDFFFSLHIFPFISGVWPLLKWKATNFNSYTIKHFTIMYKDSPGQKCCCPV